MKQLNTRKYPLRRYFPAPHNARNYLIAITRLGLGPNRMLCEFQVVKSKELFGETKLGPSANRHGSPAIFPSSLFVSTLTSSGFELGVSPKIWFSISPTETVEAIFFTSSKVGLGFQELYASVLRTSYGCSVAYSVTLFCSYSQLSYGCESTWITYFSSSYIML